MINLDIGRREQGKTTLAYWALTNRGAPRLIFDPRNMIARGSRVRSAESLAVAYGELLDGERSEITFNPPGDVQYGFALFSWYVRQWVETFPRRRLGVLVDEAAFVNTDVESFQWVLRCSSRERVHLWMTAHRPSDISTRVRAIADYWFLFAARQEHDIKVIGERCGSQVAGQVHQLASRQFVKWDDARGRHDVYLNPAQWYTPLADQAPASVQYAA